MVEQAELTKLHVLTLVLPVSLLFSSYNWLFRPRSVGGGESLRGVWAQMESSRAK